MQSKQAFYALTDGTTVAIDWTNGINQAVTLAGNRTFTMSNPVAGQTYCVKITQDASGSRTVTWPSTVKWAGGSAPTLTTTASYVDHITFIYDGTYYRDVAICKNYAL